MTKAFKFAHERKFSISLMWDEGIISQKRYDPGLQVDSYNQRKPQLRVFWFPQLLSALICTSLNQCKRITCLQIKEISVLLRCLNNKLGVTDISISPLSRKSLCGTCVLLSVSFQRLVSVEIQDKVVQWNRLWLCA